MHRYLLYLSVLNIGEAVDYDDDICSTSSVTLVKIKIPKKKKTRQPLWWPALGTYEKQMVVNGL